MWIRVHEDIETERIPVTVHRVGEVKHQVYETVTGVHWRVRSGQDHPR